MLHISGDTTKRDLQGFMDAHLYMSGQKIEQEGVNEENTDSDEDNDHDHELETEQERIWKRQRRRQRREYNDQPPKSLFQRMLWFLRHFFALPSISRKRLLVRFILLCLAESVCMSLHRALHKKN